MSIRSGVRKVEDHDEARVRGVVTAFTGITSFSVNGLPVTTSASTAFPDGSAGIVVGAAVEVEGAIRDGVLVASEVELEDHHANDDDRLNELHGTVSALDTTRADLRRARRSRRTTAATPRSHEAARPTSPTARRWRSRAAWPATG